LNEQPCLCEKRPGKKHSDQGAFSVSFPPAQRFRQKSGRAQACSLGLRKRPFFASFFGPAKKDLRGGRPVLKTFRIKLFETKYKQV